MQVYNKMQKISSEQGGSVNYQLPVMQEGIAASKIATAYTFIPCDMKFPKHVQITPVVLGSVSANGVALATTTVVPEVVSLTSFSAVTDLDAWAQNVAYNAGTVVYNGTTAYVCKLGHTSTTGGTAAADWATDLATGLYWQALDTTTFLKITHTSAGSGKVAHFTYLIQGTN